MQTSDTSLHIPTFPGWLINSFLPYRLFFLITGGQLAWTNTFKEALFPIYISFTDFLLSQSSLNLCSIQEVIKHKAKANVRVIMRQIRLKKKLLFFFKDLTHTWSACWLTANGKFPFLPGYSQKSDHVKNGTTSLQVCAPSWQSTEESTEAYRYLPWNCLLICLNLSMCLSVLFNQGLSPMQFKWV